MTENYIEEIKESIRRRARKRVPIQFIREHICKEFYIGGNSLNKMSPNDIDVFPVNDNDFSISPFSESSKVGLEIICKTKNATTTHIRYKGEYFTIQFCNYYHESLESLVNSFDFSHIQVGLHVQNDHLYSSNVYFTDDYLKSKAIESTEYTKSDYPLSSLIRLIKSGKSYIFSMIKIINDIIDRGFIDYNDFKDQLEAVDLGLLPEKFEDVELKDLWELFNLLKKS
jgi:hypothetical protein